MEINIKKLDERAVVPLYATEYSAGMDLYAILDEEVTINPGETIMISTGLAIETPIGYMSLIFARSGLASKKGLAPANKVGVVDADYRGEIKVALHNHSNEKQVVEPLERVAQLAVVPFLKVSFNIVDELNDTTRGIGGFGSTGIK